MTDQFGVYLIAVRGGKLLALRREEDDDPLFKGVLDYPGGRIEPGETPEAAAVREGVEETGLEFGEIEYLREWSHAWDDGRVFHVKTFVGWEPAGDVRLSDEHSAFAWVTPEEMLAEQYPEQMKSEIFRSWLDGLRGDTRLVQARVAEHY
ncbi:NUDIX domain-containing protein [Amycolatopsis sp. A1MSW2902]|uniref:NUDIX domain-containing protein n=1 Tax=Amycolatopsis TaxID=1813 RepID=UPI0006898B13|nr:NUDIX domain-containing protein [Amycolatopsis nivea]